MRNVSTSFNKFRVKNQMEEKEIELNSITYKP